MLKKILMGVSVLILAALTAQAVEDGLGTNVVRNLRVVPNGTLSVGGTAITNWTLLPVSTGAVSLADYLATNAVFASATSALNASVTNLSYQVTNILYGATNALDTAVTNLNARTNIWNNGVIIYKGSSPGLLVAGNLYYMDSTTNWISADASTNTTAKGLIGLALGTTPSNGLLLNGQYLTNQSFVSGAILYMGTNACAITTNAPFRTNHVVRIVGYVIDTSTIMFNPDRTYIEILGQE